MDQIKLYNILRTDLELPDVKAAEFVSALEAVTGTEMNARIQSFAAKSDVHALKSDVHELKSDVHELKSDLHELKSDVHALKSDVHALQSDVHALKSDVHSLKSDMHSLELKMYKAIFLSGSVQYIAIVASVLAIVKFIK